MRFFFFESCMKDRGNGPQPTLRALPGQTFDDGTPVDTGLNVSAPKEPNSVSGGSRGDYPKGTIFCSGHLELVNAGGNKPFYSVYDSSKGESQTGLEPYFHPVSDDPMFKFKSPDHRDEKMMIQYQLFKTFGMQESDSAPSKPAKKSAKSVSRPGPADKDGNARAKMEGLIDEYPNQREIEGELVATWMRRLLSIKGIKNPALRPHAGSVKAELTELFDSGETVETLVNAERFDALCKSEKMDNTALQTIFNGPLGWYLCVLVDEHRKQSPSTSRQRDADNANRIDEIAHVLCSEFNDQNGTIDSFSTSKILSDLSKAYKAGWTAPDILAPDVLTSEPSFGDLMDALATGKIPAPKNADLKAKSFLSKLQSNMSYSKPNSKDCFHVEDQLWWVLMRNLLQNVNTMITGPSGTGKTEIVRLLCQKTGTPFTLIQMGSITDPTEQLVGKMDLDPSTGGTKFDWADFALAVQRPGVVLLDEINRIPRNGFNILFSVLDGTREIVASGAKSTDKRVVKVNPDCVFFATANIGDEFTGTHKIDTALRTRFVIQETDHLDPKVEAKILEKRSGIDSEDAYNIALVAANIRKAHDSNALQNTVSTRETLACAEFVKDGFPVKDAMEICFLPVFEKGQNEKDPNSERGQVRAMIAGRLKGNA